MSKQLDKKNAVWAVEMSVFIHKFVYSHVTGGQHRTKYDIDKYI